MRTRVIVTSLFVVGAVGVDDDPTSFSGARRKARPVSLKIVGHGLVGLHGAGAVTIVWTSDNRKPLGMAVVGPPRSPCNESIVRYTGERPSRTTFPHDTDAAAHVAAAKSRVTMLVRFMSRQPLMIRGVMKIRSSVL